MNLVFGMDGIICTPCKDYTEVERARPLANVEIYGMVKRTRPQNNNMV